jgi:hypothetical protein
MLYHPLNVWLAIIRNAIFIGEILMKANYFMPWCRRQSRRTSAAAISRVSDPVDCGCCGFFSSSSSSHIFRMLKMGNVHADAPF